MPDATARLREILERNRARVAPELSPELLLEVADIEETHCFDDDRKAARQQIRSAIANAINEDSLEPESAP